MRKTYSNEMGFVDAKEIHLAPETCFIPKFGVIARYPAGLQKNVSKNQPQKTSELYYRSMKDMI